MKALTISIFNHKSLYFSLRSQNKFALRKILKMNWSYFTIKVDAQNICVWSYQLHSSLNMIFLIKIFMLCGTPNSNLLKICSQHQDKV